jgi:arginase family enzyme
MVHLDLDVIAEEDFRAVTLPDKGGLSFAEVQASLEEFVKHKNVLALDVSQYNPDKDPDGSGARKLVDLLVAALSARFAALSAPGSPTPADGNTAEAEPSSTPTNEPTI